MLPPSLLLTDLSGDTDGTGGDSVTVYGLRQGADDDPSGIQDAEGNWIKTPVGGADWPAVVTVQPATVTQADGTTEEIISYKVMIFSYADPGVQVECNVRWRGYDLVAAGRSIPCGPGAWQFNALESGPNPVPGSTAPYGYQPT